MDFANEGWAGAYVLQTGAPQQHHPRHVSIYPALCVLSLQLCPVKEKLTPRLAGKKKNWLSWECMLKTIKSDNYPFHVGKV